MSDKIMLQISAGQGPEECELAVGKLYESLCVENPDIRLADQSPGKRAGCYKSIRFSCGRELAALAGTVQWICASPFRPGHKRKNWFVDISLCDTAAKLVFDERLIQFETFRSSGKGGQHVNKTESGIRATYGPTGDSAVATDERSQHRNKKLAVARLRLQIVQRNQAGQGSAKTHNWLENYRIVRGNPVRIYKGIDFVRRR